MRTLAISDLVISEDRQRKAKDPKGLADLKKGILSIGLLQAPVVYWEDETKPVLIAGERRTQMMLELHEEGLTFQYDGEDVPVGRMPYTNVGELDPIQLQEAELFENVLRAALSWQDESTAKLKIHHLRLASNPEQTARATAIEISAVTQNKPESERANLVKMQAVAAHIGAPMVQKAKSLRQAYANVLDHQKRQLERDLVNLAPTETPHQVLLGDSNTLLTTLPLNHFDLILTDPPYGIEAHYMKQEIEHEYDDSPEAAMKICKNIFRLGFHLLKPQGHIFMFCDVDHFVELRTYAHAQAFTVWRTPLIWHKGLEGQAPWGKNGATRTYETVLFAVKGQKPLALPLGPDVRTIKRVARNERIHAAEKPPEYLRYLLQCAARSGDRVLDPCCGSGPIFEAAQGLGLHITGIEQNPDTHALACSRIVQASKNDAPESIVGHRKTIEEISAELFAE
jgi:site-specific DNA-methyltransferase (adenine-specific)